MVKNYKKTNNKSLSKQKKKSKFNIIREPGTTSVRRIKNLNRVSFREKERFYIFLETFKKQISALENSKKLENEKNKTKKKLNLFQFYRIYKSVKKLSNYLRFQRKYAKEYEGFLGPLTEKDVKFFRLDGFSQKYQVNSAFRFKSLHRKKVKLDRSFSNQFRKSHKRTNQRPTDRWTFVLSNLFKHFYKLNYFMTQVDYVPSVSDASQKINCKQLTKNSRYVKSSSSVFAGDMVVYNRNRFDLEDMLDSKKTRSYLNTFVEEDDYVQGVIAIKDAVELSREDALALNISSSRFTDINYLRK